MAKNIDSVYIPSGKYKIGSNVNLGYKNDMEYPLLEVETTGFIIQKTPITNALFAKFIEETNYITTAEQIGSSYVYHELINDSEIYKRVPETPWWFDVPGANWKTPFGDERSYNDYLEHPVVHISLIDALSYCRWANLQLPTEVEWEIAARFPNIDSIYPWGNELKKNNIHQANLYQGNFPYKNTMEDNYIGTAPVTEFYTCNLGINQMIGNVWELCSNKSRIPILEVKDILNYTDEEFEVSNDFFASKGGSFLCDSSYCNRYRLSARNSTHSYSSSSNVGFRCIKRLF